MNEQILQPLSAFAYLEAKGKSTGSERINDAMPRSVKKAKRRPKKKRLQPDDALSVLQEIVNL